MQREMDVTRPELEHVLTCGDCYLFDPYDGGGPHFCLAFETEFRGYVPRERTPEEQARANAMAALYAPLIKQALQCHMVYGGSVTGAASPPAGAAP
jgi:hypothetical protein